MTAARAHGMPRRAITLMEVLLALAILAGAMFLIGELIRVGARHAVTASDLSTGQMHCESVFNMLETGLLPMTGISQAAFELDPSWNYSVELQPQQIPGLLSVRVSVTRGVQPQGPATMQMTRWMINLDYVQQRVDEAAARQAEEDDSVL